MKLLLLCIPLIFLFSQCKEAQSTNQISIGSDELVMTKASPEDEPVKADSPIESNCEQLADQYKKLIDRIILNKKDKTLISELVNWTKKPAHLNCLENNQAYNVLVEELNQLL